MRLLQVSRVVVVQPACVTLTHESHHESVLRDKGERESYTSALSPTAGNTMKGFLLKFWDTIRQQLAVTFTHRVNLTITFGFSGKAG